MSDSVPEIVEPSQDYLGFACASCGHQFSIVGPLDPVEFPPERAVNIGARGKIPAECPDCHHKADYTIEQLVRFSK